MKFHSKIILVFVVLCNLAAIAGYYLLFENIKTKITAASDLSSTIDLGEQKDGHLNSLRSVIKDTEGKRQQLAAFLLTSENEIPFIEQMEGLATSSSLQERTNNVASVFNTGNTGTKSFQIQLETVGSWSNTMYFLSRLENLPYNLRIQDVTIQKGLVPAATGKSAPVSVWAATFDVSVTESI